MRNNVDDDSPIFGSAIAVEEWVFPKYRIFCPYAYHKGVSVNQCLICVFSVFSFSRNSQVYAQQDIHEQTDMQEDSQPLLCL